jgi:hypothetical protein
MLLPNKNSWQADDLLPGYQDGSGLTDEEKYYENI